jgi:hypothetical protein
MLINLQFSTAELKKTIIASHVDLMKIKKAQNPTNRYRHPENETCS